MPNRIVMRSVALAAGLTLLVSAAVLADTVGADGDRAEVGGQTFIDLDQLGLGPIGPGEVVDVEVDFVLTCRNGSHPNHGATVAMALGSSITQEDGSVTVTPGTIGPIPTTWPVDGVTCLGSPTLASSTPAIVHVTAPTVAADDYLFTVIFQRTESDGTIGTTGSTAISMEFDVVANTPPVIHVPASFTVEADTAGGWTADFQVTADDAEDDPDPTPTCSHAPGDVLPVGSTSISCTVTDSGGMGDSGSFVVTVVETSEAIFEQPVGNGGTFTVSSARTIPIKVQLFRGDAEVTTGEAWIWLAPCGETAVRVGQLERQTGRWMGHLDTGGLVAGCYQVTIRSGGSTFGGFELQVQGDVTTTSSKPKKG